ncbi:glycogen synthase [Sodalis sp. RH24]|uniref:glycogen synthase n=1 Tax=unclassified Sodalis (in: enterobacteria) TaxID=2636512 RepID=UPI0039B5AF91
MTNLHPFTPHYNYANVDFMASTVAFMERQKMSIDLVTLEAKIPSSGKKMCNFFTKNEL